MSDSHPSSVTSGTAVVTGASLGIGAAYAQRLAKRGFDLVLVARNEQRLQTLAHSLATETGVNVRTIVADLTHAADLAKVEALLAEDTSISLLVNNAGSSTMAPLAVADIDRMQRDIALNITAPTRLTHAALPGFLARNRGGIINIASVTSQLMRPGNTVYGGTKAYLLHLSQVLAAEVVGSGVQIQAVLPGATRTTLWDGSGLELHELPPSMVMEVDEMVDAALAGYDQKELVTIPSLPDPADWQRFIDARNALQPNLSHDHAADRYKQTAAA